MFISDQSSIFSRDLTTRRGADSRILRVGCGDFFEVKQIMDFMKSKSRYCPGNNVGCTSGAVGVNGGFCVGHQRVSGTFSLPFASSPVGTFLLFAFQISSVFCEVCVRPGPPVD